MLANIAIGTGFATVVGEPTAGVTGVMHTFAALPTTGILFRIDMSYTVDSRGISIEEHGVVPQIANAPGMDALETVLAIIGGEASAVAETPVQAAPVMLPIPPPPAAPVAVAATPAGTARVVNDVEFVPLRLTANAHGYTVVWDGENNAVVVTGIDGSTRLVAISTNGTFNDNGTVFITAEYATEIFS
jgi:hypothetical protein